MVSFGIASELQRPGDWEIADAGSAALSLNEGSAVAIRYSNFFAGASLESNVIKQLERTLDSACTKLGPDRSVGQGVRERLAASILEGWQRGIREPAKLEELALRSANVGN